MRPPRLPIDVARTDPSKGGQSLWLVEVWVCEIPLCTHTAQDAQFCSGHFKETAAHSSLGIVRSAIWAIKASEISEAQLKVNWRIAVKWKGLIRKFRLQHKKCYFSISSLNLGRC